MMREEPARLLTSIRLYRRFKIALKWCRGRLVPMVSYAAVTQFSLEIRKTTGTSQLILDLDKQELMNLTLSTLQRLSKVHPLELSLY